MEADPIGDHEVAAALEELLASPAISRSSNLADVLRYVVDRTLRGEGAAIKAYSIAVDVLGRPASFDPQSDPIVRVQARRLRVALDQFYASGASRSPVQIRLPTGRYVPEFVRVTAPGETAAPPPTPAITSRRRVAPGTWTSLALGLISTLFGVALTVALLRWILPPNTPQQPVSLPEFPAVAVQGFESLTPESKIDGAEVSFAITGALALFENVRVVPQNSDYVLSGTLRQLGRDFDVGASLAHGDGGGIIWSTSFSVPGGREPAAVVQDAAQHLAGLLGSPGSPLFAEGSAWLATQKDIPQRPTAYVCTLMEMAWASSFRLDDARRAAECALRLSDVDTDDAQAHATHAALSFWVAIREGGDLDAARAAADSGITRAVALAPQSAYVQFMRAIVLRNEGKFDEALAATANAVQANPSYMNAVAYRGFLQWVGGQFDAGTENASRAIAGVLTPPFWYYAIPASEAMRSGRYTDATEAGLQLSAGNPTLASALALAAAALAGKTELVDKLLIAVMGDPRAQQTGIIKQCESFIPQPVLIAKLREGLLKAGVPQAALDGPFTPTSADATASASASPG